MRIGELADRAGMSPHTIRFYEERGVLPAPERTSAGYRDYGPEAIEDLLFIRKAQTLGLRLEDIREVMDIASGGRPPCDHVRALLTERLADVDARIAELRDLRATLREALGQLDDPAPATGCRCAVIDEVEPDGGSRAENAPRRPGAAWSVPD